MPTQSQVRIYQLKVTLRDSKPPIWRRLLVSEPITLYKLHQIIQISMGWTNSHMHQFIIKGGYYGMIGIDDIFPALDENRHRLNQIAPAEGFKFEYEYDFGDSWLHQILVEKILPADPKVNYPICTKGRRACPPEDIGGIWSYNGFLEAMSDPEHEDHDSLTKWLGVEFDPEKFDIEGVNRDLKRIR